VSKKKLAVLFIMMAVPVVVYLLWPSDESRIKRLVKEGVEAVEEQNMDEAMSKVSFNYRDEHGFTYLYIEEAMKSLFQRMKDIRIEYENLKINVDGNSATAEMDARIIATVGNDTGYVFGDMPHPAHFKITLEKERTKWLVTKVEGLPGAY
jgi:phosphoribosylformylglycinamidine (FGAM) synthase-like amidotransferase family enzyme